MSLLLLDVALIGGVYAVGSFATAILVARALGLGDPRQSGSGNPGATNILRIGGKKAALLTLLGDLIKDEKSLTPEQRASYELLSDQINEIVGELTERERQILEMRFGLKDGATHTLEEVGKVFNVTRERIRQIEAKAIQKIREHEKAKKLAEY